MTTPHYSDDRVTLYLGDCRDVLPTLPDASVDSVVTDPPYGLEFMGKEWDSFGTDTSHAYKEKPRITKRGAEGGATGYCGASGVGINHFQAGPPFGRWCEAWSRECLRVLKPGGHMLAFGGSRTWHRLAAAVEDAGFELRDSIAWLYGSGFPKSRNLAGDWQGWGTALKPAFEPIVVGRKPLTGTVAANVQAHGTGALNIDACRTGMSDQDRDAINAKHAGMDVANYEREAGTSLNLSVRPIALTAAHAHDLGRWPTNVVLDGDTAAELDEQSGNVSRFFPTFHYQAKAPRRERPIIDGVAHPTVKPLDLMRWLVRLVTPAGGAVLEPFLGSGTTAEACVLEGFRCIGVERSTEYMPLALARLDRCATTAGEPQPSLFAEEVSA